MLLVQSILLELMAGCSPCRNMAVEGHRETTEIGDHLHQERMAMAEEMIMAAEAGAVAMEEAMGGEDQVMADHEEVVELLLGSGAEEKDLREAVMMDREVVEVMTDHGAVVEEDTEAAMEETEVAMEEVDLIRAMHFCGVLVGKSPILALNWCVAISEGVLEQKKL